MTNQLKMISWNVNGLRAAVKKGFTDFFMDTDADVFAIQESKLQEGQIDFTPEGYTCTWNYAEKKGYSGTAVFSKEEPLHVRYGFEGDKRDNEGRICALEFEKYWFVNVYTPNSKQDLARLDFRVGWDEEYRNFLKDLEATGKPVITCGDFNVAHKEIDLKNPRTNHRSAGFTDEERLGMTKMLGKGFTDTFRYFYPELEGAYSWWSYRANARANNTGWRIDYFLTSEALNSNLISASIHPEIFGSDHCPIELIVEL